MVHIINNAQKYNIIYNIYDMKIDNHYYSLHSFPFYILFISSIWYIIIIIMVNSWLVEHS